MTLTHARAAATPATTRETLVLRAVSFVALCVSAYVHVDLAAAPWFSDGAFTLATLFVADAAACFLVGMWMIVRGSLLSCLAAGAVAAGSLGALVLAVYVKVPAMGPMPSVYEPFWYTEKVVAAVAAGVAAAAALLAAALLRRHPHSG